MIKIYYDYYHFVLSPLGTANEHISFSSLNRNPLPFFCAIFLLSLTTDYTQALQYFKTSKVEIRKYN